MILAPADCHFLMAAVKLVMKAFRGLDFRMARKAKEVPLQVEGRRGAGGADVPVADVVRCDHD